jgi:CMP-N-acetylneuraminic acid synthetase
MWKIDASDWIPSMKITELSPLVTVYITSYNYEQFINQAINSVLGQTYQYFELIIIDDGSTDGSPEIIKQYEAHEKVFLVFQNNRGLNATNNVALRLARGKYIVRLDADDYFEPHALEVMVAELERNPDLVLVFPDYFIVDENGVVVEQIRRHDFVNGVTLLDQPAHGACTLIRRDILKLIGGYDEAFTRQDGYDLWLNIANTYSVKNVNLPLFYYRRHGVNLTTDEEQLLTTRAAIKAKHVEKRGLSALSVAAIIPVRGETTDPRSISLNVLGTKPLINWTIDAALESRKINQVFVTTPDRNLQDHVRKAYGSRVRVIARDAELARINTRIEDTILDTLDYCPTTINALMVLYIEAPFRSETYINKAIDTMQLYAVDVVDGVRLDDSLFYVHDGHGLKPWKSQGGLRLERDDLYRRVGGLHLIRRDIFEEEGKMLTGKIGHITLDQRSAFVIKSEFDWKVAQLLIKEAE